MTTNEFITMVMEEVSAGFTRTRILEFTNRIQNEILANDNQLMRVRPDPFMTTVDATYGYTATSSLFVSTTGAAGAAAGDIRTVKDIYTFNSGVSIFDLGTIDPTSSKPNQVEPGPSTDKVHARFECVDSIAPDSSDCSIRWWEGNNPGATTITWRAEAYRWPTQLTAETIALSIPADFHHTLLFYGVLRHLERREYGRNDYAIGIYESELKRFKAKYNRMATQDRLGVCAPRDC